MSTMSKSQASDAQRLYDDRSQSYDDSWHPRFARHLVELAKPQPDENVLDLACGTGLVTFAAAEAVGPSGHVVGIDISGGMLAEARKKLSSAKNVKLHQHSITELETLAALEGKEGTFDLITIASALVLLPEPEDAAKKWTTWLKPGGRLIVDVTHPQSQIAGITLERVGKRMGLPVPHYRLNFMGPEDLRNVLEAAGLAKIELRALSQLSIAGTEKLDDYSTDFDNPRISATYIVEDGDTVFDQLADTRGLDWLTNASTREQARQIFREEWSTLASPDGRIQEYDCVYVGLGWKPSL